MQYDKIGDEYVLLKELGHGGFATVYKAKNIEYGYVRAIRVLDAHVENTESKIFQSFQRECRILLRLGNGCHPNIVHVYQPRQVAGRAFMEMDWIDGIDLRQLIEHYGGVVPIDETIRMVKEIGSALAYCHHDIYKFSYDRESDNLDDADDGSALITPAKEKELINKYRVTHNDIHTGNIMRRHDGTYILLDFGLAVDGSTDKPGSSRKEHGAIEFKSPERCEGFDPTPEDDIYSLGCVIYAMISGKPPFPAQVQKGKIVSDAENARIVYAHKNTPPSPITRDDVPQWLINLTMRCLEKDPSKRYADGFELNKDIVKHTQAEKSDKNGVETIDSYRQGRMQELEEENFRLMKREKILTEHLNSVQKQYDEGVKTNANLGMSLDKKISETQALKEKIASLQNDFQSAKKKKQKLGLGMLLGMLIGVALCAIILLALKGSHAITIPKDTYAEELDNRIIELSDENESMQLVIDSLEHIIAQNPLKNSSTSQTASSQLEMAQRSSKNSTTKPVKIPNPDKSTGSVKDNRDPSIRRSSPPAPRSTGSVKDNRDPREKKKNVDIPINTRDESNNKKGKILDGKWDTIRGGGYVPL